MTSYYVASSGQVSGPFSETQLLELWHARQITGGAEICEEGTWEWFSIRVMIAAIQRRQTAMSRP